MNSLVGHVEDLSRLELLIPNDAVEISKDLEASLENDGLILPLVVCGSKIADGQKRYRFLKSRNIQEAPVIRVAGTASFLRWKLNGSRAWNIVETALVWKDLPDPDRGDFLRSLQHSPSPHLNQALQFIVAHPASWREFMSGKIPFSALRDLAHLGDQMEALALHLIGMKATAGEKRLLANLLRQGMLRGPIPTNVQSDVFDVFRQRLESLTQPRRTNFLEKFQKTLDDLSFPSGTKIDIDPTLEKPGISLQLSVKRKTTQKLKDVQEKIETLFERLPEL